MAIGIDDIDYNDDEYGTNEVNNTQTQDNDSYDDQEERDYYDQEDNDNYSDNLTDSDIVSELLRYKGIEDKSKIKFENDNGQIEEYDWDNLSGEDKLNIISSQESIEDDLDDSEVELLNAIRRSKMTPAEYLNYIQQEGVNSYLQNAQQPAFQVDQFSDDELYVYDLIQQVGEDNITEEEAMQELESAKSNPELYNKKIGAIRAEYQKLEKDRIYQQQAYQQQQAQANFNQFASQIAHQIDNFNGFSGLQLELDPDDKQELFEFITGMDAAGTSILGKALNDPKVLVPAAWFALNGSKVFQEVNDYFTNEIKQVSKSSYQKGVEDARAGKVKINQVQVVSKPRKKNNSDSSDLSIDNIW